MKGYKDSSGKFHPITKNRGVRKSRDQSAKSIGVQVERKARDHTSFCPVCEHNITRVSEQEVRRHIKEHIKMQEHREHTKLGIICDCGVRKTRYQKDKTKGLSTQLGLIISPPKKSPKILIKQITDDLDFRQGLIDTNKELKEEIKSDPQGDFAPASREEFRENSKVIRELTKEIKRAFRDIPKESKQALDRPFLNRLRVLR